MALVPGSTNERAVKAATERLRVPNVRFVMVRGYAEAMLALETDRVDAIATGEVVMWGLRNQSCIKDQLVMTGRLLSCDPYGLMLRRDDSAVRLMVNTTLAGIFRLYGPCRGGASRQPGPLRITRMIPPRPLRSSERAPRAIRGTGVGRVWGAAGRARPSATWIVRLPHLNHGGIAGGITGATSEGRSGPGIRAEDPIVAFAPEADFTQQVGEGKTLDLGKMRGHPVANGKRGDRK
ncbi:MAG: transporter substrate-binding domain-containing protein [Alphaproteobacteria bacterium]|nr:transporter substrate-binding domain-containing protein [Alphaproteobacteria bacterium]